MSTSSGIRGRVVLLGQMEQVNMLEMRISVPIAGPNREFREVEAVIDTGFTGFLTLPAAAVLELDLLHYHDRQVRVANDQVIRMPIFEAFVQWQGQERGILVHQTENPRPLVGMALLEHCRLTVDLQVGGPVAVTPLPD